MIHEYNDDRTGYAQFSDDGLMRYHLIRMVSQSARAVGAPPELGAQPELGANGFLMANATTKPREWLGLHRSGADDRQATANLRIVTFLLQNPSTATAWKNDPTVNNCMLFTIRWNYDITWIVNLHAYRSSWPRDLKRRAVGFRGDDHTNNTAIITACRCADLVIAGWGLEGALDRRDQLVMNMLRLDNIPLHHIGLTKDGFPKHPHARGVHRIPVDQQPIRWEAR